ncbi:aromatic amino acid lyase [Lacibacterium aquatile]|uniref:Aromatic amino acid lyase n=1 Tax=Lacibacterium aquatile TaxID=1168082 RepID=A0ABW5DSS8_9PROT
MSVTLHGPESLTPEVYEAVVYGGAQVEITEDALARVTLHRVRFMSHLATGVVCYGVNTGLGALSKTDLSDEDIAALPRQILLGRAVAFGPPMPGEVARGAMLIKLSQFLSGATAVTPALCGRLVLALNDGMTPYIPAEGHGMAGEIVPLTHLAQTLLGEGRILEGGVAVSAASWLRAKGHPLYDPRPKEGIALINGIAVAPALAYHHLRGLRRLWDRLTLVASAAIEGLAAPLEPYDPAVALLRPEPGMEEVAAAILAAVKGSAITRQKRQAPVSFRVIPQIHGSLLLALDTLEAAILTEMQAVGDNPAFVLGRIPSEDRLLHCGNFHGAAMTAAIEATALALAQAALLSERRLQRLLDARYTGLSPQLALKPGLDAGMVAIHKAALAFAAQVKAQSVPPSLMHADSSFGQEDAMTMAIPALDRLVSLMGLTDRLLACELYTALAAIDQRGETPGAQVEALRAEVRKFIPAYAGDRSYGTEIEALMEFLGRA